MSEDLPAKELGPADRLYPPRPIVAASIAVFRDERVLIARRARAPWAGAFSLPGGVVEVGETLEQAALRELREEVGIEARVTGFVRHVQPIAREGERVKAHFVIAVFKGLWLGGEPKTSQEVSQIEWVDPLALGERPTTPELADILRRAAALACARGGP